MTKIEKTIWTLIIFIVSIMVVGLYSMSSISNTEDHVKVIKQEKIIDSLTEELFIKETEVGRYEITLELLKEEDSISAAKFTNILEHETE
jgi:hypothetical protein